MHLPKVDARNSPSEILVWVTTGLSVIVLGVLLVLGIKSHSKHAEELVVEEANLKVSSATNAAETWIKQGSLSGQAKIRDQLRDAKAIPEATNKSRLDDVSTAFEAKVAECESSAIFRRAIAELRLKQTKTAKSSLLDYLKRAVKPDLARANLILADLGRAESQAFALDLLEKLDDDQFKKTQTEPNAIGQTFCEASIGEIWLETVSNSVVAEAQRREIKKRNAEVERIVAQNAERAAAEQQKDQDRKRLAEQRAAFVEAQEQKRQQELLQEQERVKIAQAKFQEDKAEEERVKKSVAVYNEDILARYAREMKQLPTIKALRLANAGTVLIATTGAYCRRKESSEWAKAFDQLIKQLKQDKTGMSRTCEELLQLTSIGSVVYVVDGKPVLLEEAWNECVKIEFGIRLTDK